MNKNDIREIKCRECDERTQHTIVCSSDGIAATCVVCGAIRTLRYVLER